MIYILLSTYNGELYLKELLDSLLNQDFSDFKILIRDDGSQDGTRKILEDYEKKYSEKIKVFFEENIGVVNSFFALLKCVPDNYEYIAFCDQDDVWQANKISRAVFCLQKCNETGPKMYCSRLNVVDSSLNHLWFSKTPRKKLSFSNAVIESAVTGCTIMLNKSGVNLILDNLPDPSKVFMHDWWIYLVISAFGKIIYDENALILYRQHLNNVMGTKRGFFLLLKRVKNFLQHKNAVKKNLQLQEFFNLFGSRLSSDKKIFLQNYLKGNKLTFFERWKIVTGNSFYRQSRIDDLIFKVFFIFGMN